MKSHEVEIGTHRGQFDRPFFQRIKRIQNAGIPGNTFLSGLAFPRLITGFAGCDLSGELVGHIHHRHHGGVNVTWQ